MLHDTIGGRNNGYGSFDEGRTLVHEVGHYLGLQHTFNPTGACESNTYSAGDLVVDTPAQENPDYGSASSDCGVTSALNNFMNYSYDNYMYTFTSEQTNRMICSLTSYRSSAYTISYDNGPTSHSHRYYIAFDGCGARGRNGLCLLRHSHNWYQRERRLH